MKKFVILASMFLAISSVVFTGCKKGEEDPAISLKSRDSRLKREWKLASGTATVVVDYENDDLDIKTKTTYASTYTGTMLTQTQTVISDGDSDSDSDSWPYTETITFEDGGKFTSTTIEDGVTTTETGNWAWADSDKNKANIYMDGELVQVVGLSSDELIVKTESSESEIDPDADTKEATSISATMTYSAQ